MGSNGTGSFLARITAAPLAEDARAAELGWERLAEAHPAHAADISEMRAEPRLAALLAGTFGCSPYLTHLAVREFAWLRPALHETPEKALSDLIAEMRAGAAGAEEAAAVMTALRKAKARAALYIGLGDLGGVLPLEAVTGGLSAFADAAIEAGLAFLLKDAARRGELDIAASADPLKDCGYFVLAMGKYGANELNYSSDIDLIALYDRWRLPVAEGVEPSAFAVRLTRDLVRFLQERTADGYVFRTDLRLRPDGGASPLALATEAAEFYYESAGQNWERAAMIKARVCGGDMSAGEAFLKEIAPFIWRKNLDHAAIEDIHSIKRQIHAHKGHADVAVAGHNLKLGRGGIREIEFFAQTQQLIVGGREPELRVRATCAALGLLAQKGMIEPEARDGMADSYAFLRTVEHRLQMLDDEQTHSLPATADGMRRIARFCGFADTQAFEAEVLRHLNRVQYHYARLFEASDTLAGETGSLIFTGVDEDPETLETLTGMGYRRARDISQTIRRWHHGHIRATRSARARERLTKLVPILLTVLARGKDADQAFVDFARFVEALPTGVQLFSLLIAHPELLQVLSGIFGLAPRLARTLAARPAILDSLLDPESLGERHTQDEIDAALRESLANAADLELKLDHARIFARERQFRAALAVLQNVAAPKQAGEAFTQTAEAVVRCLFEEVEAEFARRHGRVPGGEWAVLALGKLGGREMTATSDLDLVFVYGFDPAQETSDGAHPLHASQYYARAGQRLISLLTVPTSEGALYEVDMRLRPSGKAGPVAVTLERLKGYHESQAWVFEKMALTRARVVAGSPRLGREAEAAIRDILTSPRDLAELARDAMDMRGRLAEAKKVSDPWSLKQVRGGLVDLEYIAQVLQLALAAKAPEVLSNSTQGAFEAMQRLQLLPEDDAASLIDAAQFLSGLSQLLRICLDEEQAPDVWAEGLKAQLVRFGSAPNFEALERGVIATEARVLQLFEKYVQNLAQTLKP